MTRRLDLRAMIANSVPDAPRLNPPCAKCPALLASGSPIGPARCHDADGRLIAETFSSHDAAPSWCPRMQPRALLRPKFSENLKEWI